ncbi:hypothetical protein Tco_0584968 [Tanacetum coccineum]
MPEQMRVGEFLPTYYISQLEDSIIIYGSFRFGNCRILYAWDLQVDDGKVSSYRQLFTIPYPAEHELKLLGFSKDKQPIVEAAIFQQWHQSLQVFNLSFQTFQNVGVEANRDTWTVLRNYRLPRVGTRIKRSWGLAVVDVMEGGHDNIITTQEYVRKVNEDVSEYDHFMLGPWLSAICMVKGKWHLFVLAI